MKKSRKVNKKIIKRSRKIRYNDDTIDTPVDTPVDTIDDVKTTVSIIFSTLNTLKLYHWQTTKFADHKSSDDLISKLNDKFDHLLEVYQGIYGKLNLDSIFIVVRQVDIRKFIQDKIDFFNGLKTYRDSDLLNIRDDIVADLHQFLYLLTFN